MLTEAEKRWLGPIMVVYAKVEPVVKEVPRWMLRIDEKERTQWIKQQNTPCLLFHEAAKGNPGAASAGGVIWCPGRQDSQAYAIGLSKEINNEVEATSLWIGLLLINQMGFDSSIVLGDSKFIVSTLCKESLPYRPVLHLVMMQAFQLWR